MTYQQASDRLLRQDGVEHSTMMKTPCLRYRGSFLAMMFDKEDALIVKLAPDRVNALIDTGDGLPFNYTKKRFKEWVLIPLEFEDEFEAYLNEALTYAKSNLKPKPKSKPRSKPKTKPTTKAGVPS